jgi:DMSO reductase anchor subunit
MSHRRGFFGSLFDFSFSSFVFPKLISFLYAFFAIVLTIAAVGAIVSAFMMEDFSEVFGVPPWASLIAVPVAYLLYLIVLRVWMEIAIVLFRIYENTDVMAGRESS